MSNATVSRLGQANASGDANALFLKLFSGEVLKTFQQKNKMLGMTFVKNISQGKSSQFPVTGTISSAYHTIGNEILGTAVKHNEKVINVDDMLIAHAFIGEIDELKNHYSARAIYSSEMGSALANKVDQHLLQLSVLAARGSATISGGNGGSVITDADAKTNAASLITSIFEAAEDLDDKNVPETDRYAVVTPDVYYQLVQNDKILNRDFGGTNGVYADGTVIKVAGINIVKANTATTAFTDRSGDSTTGQNNTYVGNFATTACVVFHKSAIGTVMLKNISLESSYDPRRLGTLMVSKMAIGSGILRPEAAVEIKTA